MFSNELWHKSTVSTFSIDQSIRFNQADSPYMEKTYSSNGNRQTWTLSFWTKLGKVPPYNTTRAEWFLAYNTTSGAQEDIRIDGSTQQLRWFTHNDGGSGTLADLKTTQLLRDHSAWYHIICVADRTNATAGERQKIYINGQRVTDFATETYPSQNAEGHIGKSADKHYIGSRGGNVNTRIDGYMAEIVFIDGTALDETSFGEYNSSNIWVPKDVSGLSFGTNGFHIDGRDSADLGDDESGNGNDYSTSGLASHDQVSDSPTNNFCVISPINMGSATGVTLQNGNLDGATSGTAGNMPASISLDSGKWYWEVNNHANGSGNNFGVGETPTGSFDQFSRGSNGNTVNTNAKTTTGSSGQIIGFKLDFDAGTLTHTTNGTSYSSTGSLTANMAYAPHSRLGASSGRVVFNFGQDSTFGGLETAGGNSDGNGVGNFYYSVPSGFLAICTKNLGS